MKTFPFEKNLKSRPRSDLDTFSHFRVGKTPSYSQKKIRYCLNQALRLYVHVRKKRDLVVKCFFCSAKHCSEPINANAYSNKATLMNRLEWIYAVCEVYHFHFWFFFKPLHTGELFHCDMLDESIYRVYIVACIVFDRKFC